MALAALYSTELLTEERKAEIENQLAARPYQPARQAELLLRIGETPASSSGSSVRRGTG